MGFSFDDSQKGRSKYIKKSLCLVGCISRNKESCSRDPCRDPCPTVPRRRIDSRHQDCKFDPVARDQGGWWNTNRYASSLNDRYRLERDLLSSIDESWSPSKCPSGYLSRAYIVLISIRVRCWVTKEMDPSPWPSWHTDLRVPVYISHKCRRYKGCRFWTFYRVIESSRPTCLTM